MFVILIAEIALASYVFVNHEALKGTLKQGFTESLGKYKNETKIPWDYVQTEVSRLLATQEIGFRQKKILYNLENLSFKI